MIKYKCPHCGSVLSIPEKFAGQTGRCKRCGKTITVPAARDAVHLNDLKVDVDEALPAPVIQAARGCREKELRKMIDGKHGEVVPAGKGKALFVVVMIGLLGLMTLMFVVTGIRHNDAGPAEQHNTIYEAKTITGRTLDGGPIFQGELVIYTWAGPAWGMLLNLGQERPYRYRFEVTAKNNSDVLVKQCSFDVYGYPNPNVSDNLSYVAEGRATFFNLEPGEPQKQEIIAIERAPFYGENVSDIPAPLVHRCFNLSCDTGNVPEGYWRLIDTTNR